MIDATVERMLACEHRVALELQHGLRDDHHEQTHRVLDLHVIVEAPGPKHSRYSTVFVRQFFAEDQAERDEAHRIAREIAAAVGLPLHAPHPAASGGQGESSFLRALPVGEPVGYPIVWSASWWTRDGRRHLAAGTEIVDAASGDAACAELERRLARWPLRPLTLHVGETHGRAYGAPELPGDTVRALRVAARQDPRASAVARQFPAATPLALILGFAEAFHCWLDALEPLGAWRAGEITDRALDAAADIAASRDDWERGFLLEECHAAGRSVTAFLRATRPWNTIRVFLDIRELFELSFGAAKGFVDDVAHGRDTDAELDARLVRRS